MLFHGVVVNIHLLVFWKVFEKTSSGENPQLESLKLNVTEYHSLLYGFLRNPLCLLQVHFQVFLLVSGGHNSVSLGGHCYQSLLMCSDTEFSEEEKRFIPLEKAKQGLHRPAFNSVCKFQQQNCSYSF